MNDVKLGFMYYGDRIVGREGVVDLVHHAERVGFDSFWVPEHQALYPRANVEMAAFGMSFDYTRPHPDSLQVLALAAAISSKITLGAFLLLPCHHPVVLAKQLATLDVLSGGRVRLCVGVGDLRREIEACGADFASRGRRTDESIDVMRALWTSDQRGASFAGEFFSFRNLVSYPQPADGRLIPIDVGGASTAAVKRAAQRGDGFYPSYTLSEDEYLQKFEEVRLLSQRYGRDPDSMDLARTVWLGETHHDVIDSALQFGVKRLICMAKMQEPELIKDEMSAIAQRYLKVSVL